jgi:RNA polymerase sigma-70 factor (sigma-E family)
VKDGDQGNFADYAVATMPHLRWQAYLLCGNWHEADDLVQDTLIKVYRRWPQLQRRDELAAYTGTTLLRTFLNARRGSRPHCEVLCASPPELPGQSAHDLIESRVLLLAALCALGRTQRCVIILRFWEDLPVSEVAEILGIAPGTVTSHTNRALARMRVTMAGSALIDG